jgi:hypothetical protein
MNEKLARDKCASQLPKFVNYGRKKFYNICLRKRWTEVKIV